MDFGSGQGSILGPVLFYYYVALLVIKKKILTYADDNYQAVSNKCKNAAVKELEEQMSFKQWMSGSGLRVNIEKTEIVVFHRHDTSKAVIKINDIEVKSKQSMCVLGVHFDNRLTWDIHVDTAIM